MAKPAPTDKLAAAFDALKQGRLPQAAKLARVLATERPNDARAHSLLARVLAATDDLAGARVAVDRALAIDARSVPALIESASLARRAADIDRAAADLTLLVELQPLFAGFHHDLGVLELDRGNLAAARDALVRARGLAPNQPDTRFKLANLEYREGNWAQAAAEYQAAVTLKPDLTEAWLNLGEALFKLERHADALVAFRRAAALDADSFKAHEGASRCLWEMKANMRDWLDAREAMTRIEGTAEAYTRLGADYGKASRFAAARDAYLRAIELDPDYLSARWGAMQAPRDLMYADDAALATYREEWRAGLAWFEAHEYVPERVAEYVAVVLQSTNFYLHYLGEPFRDEQRRYARVIERMMAVAVAQLPAAPAVEPRARDGRIRVGICSGFMRQHTVMKLFSALITGLDRSRFELSLFYTAAIDNDGTKPLREHADFFMLGERTPAEWIPAIRARELDVLLFLDVGMHPMLQALAAQRFAPRQYVLWGHPVTTGFASIDAFLTSDAMELPDAQRFYHERLVRLPRLGCCFAPPTLAPVHPPELVADPSRVEVFFAQSAFKILPAFDDILARIAERVPSVRFHVTPHPQMPVREAYRQRLSRAFAARGLALDQHVGVNRFVSEAEFLGLARACAFSLDSIGWSGGNTTLEILWCDTPVLTLPGELMRSRHTAAILGQLELSELIASDVDDYVDRAVRLATDPAWRESLRMKIRERKMRLYDDRGVVEAFANVLAGEN